MDLEPEPEPKTKHQKDGEEKNQMQQDKDPADLPLWTLQNLFQRGTGLLGSGPQTGSAAGSALQHLDTSQQHRDARSHQLGQDQNQDWDLAAGPVSMVTELRLT